MFQYKWSNNYIYISGFLNKYQSQRRLSVLHHSPRNHMIRYMYIPLTKMHKKALTNSFDTTNGHVHVVEQIARMSTL